MLLQTQLSGTLDMLDVCAALLLIIVGLITFIWRSNENKASERHQDLMRIVNGLEKKQNDHEARIIGVEMLLSLLQGKPISTFRPTANHEEN